MEFRLPHGEVVRWEWLDASARGSWTGLETTGDTSSYYLGSDPARWVRSAANYKRIIRRELYPGIDQIAYVSGDAVEYDLVLHPGADPARVRLHAPDGRTKAGANGGLRTKTGLGDIVQGAPVAWQIINGMRVPVVSRFVAEGPDTFRLHLDDFDSRLPLYIDPTVRAVFAVTGNDDDRVVASTDTLTIGVTRSADWKRSPGTDSDVFVRFRTGNSVRTLFWGGDGDDEVTGFTPGVGAFPLPAIVGWTTSRNLPIIESYGIRAQRTYGGGESDGFMAGLSPSDLQFSTYIGGNGRDRLYSVAVTTGPLGTAYLAAGETNSTAWGDVHAELRGRGGLDALIAKVSNLGVEAITLGGSGDDRATAIAASESGAIAVAGDTASDDFPVTPGQTALRFGLTDAWLVRMQWQELPQILTASMWGGSGDERVAAVAYSPGGNLYAAGTTTSTDYPVLNAAQPQYGGGASDGFIARFGPADAGMLMSTFFGGSGRDEILAIAMRSTDLLLAGATDSPDFANGAPAGGMDGWFAHVDPAGRKVWATLFGGPDDDRILSVQPLPTGEVRVTGWTKSRAWLIGLGPDESLSGSLDPLAGTTDGFAATIAYNFAAAADQRIGKDLQVAVPLVVSSQDGADGIVVVRSADPGKLLVSTSALAPGAEQLTVFDADTRAGVIYLQALDSAGDVDVILSGRFYPERRVRVHLLPSALFAVKTSVSVPANQTVVSFTLFISPVNEQTGEALGAQTVRAGVDPTVLLPSPDEIGLRPRNRNAPDLTFNFDILKSGAYTLAPYSPVFPTANGQRIQLQVGGGDGIVGRLWLANGGRTLFPYDAMGQVPLRLISEDPSKVVLSAPNQGSSQGSLYLTTATGVYVDSLADSGTVAVRVEGPNDYRARILFTLGTAEVSITPRSVTIPVDGVAPMALRMHPFGVAPAGFTAPPQWIVPGLAAGVLFDTNILQYEYFNFNYNFQDPAWQFGFRALRIGRTDVELSALPVGAIAAVRRMSVQVQPGTITFGRPTIDIPEGFGLLLQPVLFVGTHAATVAQMNIGNTQVADILYTGLPVLTMPVTVNLSAFGSTILRAKGKAGQTTTLTLKAQGVDSMDIPVRIVRPVLVPEAQEYWVNGKALLTFRMRALDPDTGLSEASFIYNTDNIASIPAIIQSSSSVCQFGSDLQVAGYFLTLAATCDGDGDVTIQVRPANFAPTPNQARVHIFSGVRAVVGTLSPYGQLFPARVLTGSGLQSMLEVPYGFNSEITFTSGDPAKVLLSLKPDEAGQVSVKTSSQGKVWFQGFASEGTVPVTADIAGVGRTVMTTFLMPGTLAVTPALTAEAGLREVQRTVGASGMNLAVRPALVEPATGAVYVPGSLAIRGDMDPFLLHAVSSNPDVVEPQPPSPIFSGGGSYQPLNFRARAPGVADLSVTQPDGFVTAPAASLRVRVTRPKLAIAGRALTGKDAQTALVVITSVGSVPPGVAISVTSLNPDKLLVAATPQTPGQSSVTLTNGAQFYLQGLGAEGSAQVRLQAQGYDDAVITADFLPVVVAPSPAEYRIQTPGAGANLTLQYGLWENGRFAFDWNGSVRPGVTPSLTVRPEDDTILQLVDSGRIIFQAGGPSSYTVQLRILRPGDTQILIENVADISLTTDRVPVHIANWQFSIYPTSIALGRSLSIPLEVRNPRPDTVSATLSATGDAALLFSLDRLVLGQAPLALELPGSGEKTVYLEAAGPGSASIARFSAIDFDMLQLKLEVVDPVVSIGGVNNSGLAAQLSEGSVSVPVALGVDRNGFSEQALGASHAPVTVNFQSSDTGVVRLAVVSLDFRPGESSRPLMLLLTGKGTAVITAQTPAGFNLPALAREFSVTVK